MNSSSFPIIFPVSAKPSCLAMKSVNVMLSLANTPDNLGERNIKSISSKPGADICPAAASRPVLCIRDRDLA